MPRMQLTDEEAEAVLELRRRNAVRDARNAGLDEAIRVVDGYSRGAVRSDASLEQILRDLCHLIAEEKR